MRLLILLLPVITVGHTYAQSCSDCEIPSSVRAARIRVTNQALADAATSSTANVSPSETPTTL